MPRNFARASFYFFILLYGPLPRRGRKGYYLIFSSFYLISFASLKKPIFYIIFFNFPFLFLQFIWESLLSPASHYYIILPYFLFYFSFFIFRITLYFPYPYILFLLLNKIAKPRDGAARRERKPPRDFQKVPIFAPQYIFLLFFRAGDIFALVFVHIPYIYDEEENDEIYR